MLLSSVQSGINPLPAWRFRNQFAERIVGQAFVGQVHHIDRETQLALMRVNARCNIPAVLGSYRE